MSLQIQQPSEYGFTIYTRENCVYCTKAKDLLKEESNVIISCDEYLKEDRTSFINYMDLLTKKEHRTFPMVFHNGTFIGGYTETLKYFEQYKIFNNDDF
jgi:glutaredoxin